MHKFYFADAGVLLFGYCRALDEIALTGKWKHVQDNPPENLVFPPVKGAVMIAAIYTRKSTDQAGEAGAISLESNHANDGNLSAVSRSPAPVAALTASIGQAAPNSAMDALPTTAQAASTAAGMRPQTCHCAEGWICEAHPDQSWPDDD